MGSIPGMAVGFLLLFAVRFVSLKVTVRKELLMEKTGSNANSDLRIVGESVLDSIWAVGTGVMGGALLAQSDL